MRRTNISPKSSSARAAWIASMATARVIRLWGSSACIRPHRASWPSSAKWLTLIAGMLASALADDLRSQPTLAGDQIAQVSQCRVARIRLELVPWRAQCGQVGDEQRVDLGQVVLAQCSNTRLQSARLNAARTRRAARFSVSKAGSSNRWRTSCSMATLIRSSSSCLVLRLRQGANHRVSRGGAIWTDTEMLANDHQMPRACPNDRSLRDEGGAVRRPAIRATCSTSARGASATGTGRPRR